MSPESAGRNDQYREAQGNCFCHGSLLKAAIGEPGRALRTAFAPTKFGAVWKGEVRGCLEAKKPGLWREELANPATPTRHLLQPFVHVVKALITMFIMIMIIGTGREKSRGKSKLFGENLPTMNLGSVTSQKARESP